MGLFDRSSSDAPFDRVLIELPTGEHKALSPRDFADLPLDERIRCILGKRLKFFLKGKEVPVKEALASVR